MPCALEERGILSFCSGFTAICPWWSCIIWNNPFPALLYDRIRNAAQSLLDIDKVCCIVKKLNWLLGVYEVGCCRENPRTGSFVSQLKCCHLQKSKADFAGDPVVNVSLLSSGLDPGFLLVNRKLMLAQVNRSESSFSSADAGDKMNIAAEQ